MAVSPVLKKVALALAMTAVACVALVLLAAGGLVGWMKVSGWKAHRRAEALCTGVTVGEPVADVAARAQAQGALWGDGDAGKVAEARFASWGFHACRMTVVDGKVATKRVVDEDYD